MSVKRKSFMGYVPIARIVNAAALFLLLNLMLGSAAWAPARAAEPLRLLVLGDSLVSGYGLPEADAFTARLEKALKDKGHAVAVLNGGVAGDTSAGGRARLGWALADRPHAMIVELGANDGLRGLAPEATFENIDAILARAGEAGVPVLLAGMLAPPNLGADYGREFKAVYERLARKHDVLFHPFFLDGVAAEPTLNQDDGIHPNAAGVAAIVARMLPLVERLLARAERAAK